MDLLRRGGERYLRTWLSNCWTYHKREFNEDFGPILLFKHPMCGDRLDFFRKGAQKGMVMGKAQTLTNTQSLR